MKKFDQVFEIFIKANNLSAFALGVGDLMQRLTETSQTFLNNDDYDEDDDNDNHDDSGCGGYQLSG